MKFEPVPDQINVRVVRASPTRYAHPGHPSFMASPWYANRIGYIFPVYDELLGGNYVLVNPHQAYPTALHAAINSEDVETV